MKQALLVLMLILSPLAARAEDLSNYKWPESKGELVKLLRDIHGFYSIVIPMYVWLPILLLIVGAIGYYLYRRFFNKKVELQISNFELTIQELRALDASSTSKAFYFEYSEVIKLYLQTEFEHPFMDKTTEEIKEALLREPMVTTAQSLLLVKQFEKGDLAKFAMKELDLEEKAMDVQSAIALITEIKHRIDEERAAAALKAKQGFDEENSQELKEAVS